MFANCVKTRGNRGCDEEAWRELLNDLDRLAEKVDKEGQPLYVDGDGESWGAVFLFSCGDLQQLCEGWGLPHYTSSGDMCGYCLGNKSTYNHTDLRRCANWRPTEALLTNAVCVFLVRAEGM